MAEPAASVTWDDEVDEVLEGDLTAGLAYLTPAGGAVVTAVAPIGLRDRAAGLVTFTTSFGFAKKLDRIRRDPRVALAYHARDHGLSRSERYVLVQGLASIREPDPGFLRDVVTPQATRYLGPPRQGRFWDYWMREYYEDRVGVDVRVQRIVSWPDLEGRGEPEVVGEPLPVTEGEPQRPPRGGTGPRVDAAVAARRLARLPHRLLAFRGADGYPFVVPVEVGEPGPAGLRVRSPGALLAPGGRRAGLLGHDYRPQLTGLITRQHTGWLEAEGPEAGVYAPHTESGFRAPANKMLLLLANGFLAKRNVRRDRRAKAAG